MSLRVDIPDTLPLAEVDKIFWRVAHGCPESEAAKFLAELAHTHPFEPSSDPLDLIRAGAECYGQYS